VVETRLVIRTFCISVEALSRALLDGDAIDAFGGQDLELDKLVWTNSKSGLVTEEGAKAEDMRKLPNPGPPPLGRDYAYGSEESDRDLAEKYIAALIENR
jgi:hypothetical protein